MGVKEAITQLEIIATNMVGRLCEIPKEVERQIAILNKQIEALDMAIISLKEKAEQSQINTAENTDEIQSRPTAEILVRPTATSSTEVPWWKGE